MKLISRNVHAFKWIYQETGLYVNVLHEMLSFTDLLQSGEKPVPFRNRYYFPTLIFPMTSPTKPIKVPAIEPSFPVTDSSPTEEGRTPEQTPRKEYSESQPKVTISLTHSLTHRQTDRQTTSDNGSFSIIAERQSIKMKEAH